jgi:hypothetical protein
MIQAIPDLPYVEFILANTDRSVGTYDLGDHATVPRIGETLIIQDVQKMGVLYKVVSVEYFAKEIECSTLEVGDPPPLRFTAVTVHLEQISRRTP